MAPSSRGRPTGSHIYPFPLLLPFRLTLPLLFWLLSCLGFSGALADDNGATFLFPTGGETFYKYDFVNVTYQSSYSAATLYTYCSVNGNTNQVRNQSAPAYNGSVLVYMDVDTNVPCWFDLAPELSSGEDVNGDNREKWTVLSRTHVQTTWQPTATATSAGVSAASQASSPPPGAGLDGDRLSSGATAGIAIGISLAIILLTALGFVWWWRRRERRHALAKNMVNFVDGDIVNLVDGGRFEKKPMPPGSYSTYPSSSYNTSPTSHSTTPDYGHPDSAPTPTHYPPAHVHGRGDYTPVAYTAPSMPSGSNAMLGASSSTIPLGVGDNASWSNDGRHPYSPPGYDAHSPDSETSIMHADFPFSNAATAAVLRGHTSSSTTDLYGQGPATPPTSFPIPVEALPAILPDPKPQAELPARDGVHGYGYEQELPAPQQEPLRRHGPPNGQDDAEQKFLLADVLPLRQKKSKGQGDPGPAG